MQNLVIAVVVILMSIVLIVGAFRGCAAVIKKELKSLLPSYQPGNEDDEPLIKPLISAATPYGVIIAGGGLLLGWGIAVLIPTIIML